MSLNEIATKQVESARTIFLNAASDEVLPIESKLLVLSEAFSAMVPNLNNYCAVGNAARAIEILEDCKGVLPTGEEFNGMRNQLTTSQILARKYRPGS